MNRQAWKEAGVFCGLWLLAVIVRLYFRDVPNFAPVAALALFSGFYFRSSVAALALPLAVMLTSDAFLGGYDWVVMLAVYGMLAAPVALRGILRNAAAKSQNIRGALRFAGILGGGTLAGSFAFFLVTNLAAWWAMDIYPLTLSGLVECYWYALPFFRYTLVGDLGFAAVLFGAHALVALLASSAASKSHRWVMGSSS